MFENYIQKVYKNLIGKIDTDKKNINIGNISNSEIDDYYRHFVLADVNYQIYKDKLERFANIYFDFSDEEFKAKIDELDAYYRQNAIYPKSKFQDLLKSAIEIRLNILIRPLHSFNWFVFKNELTKPLNEILLKLDYISDYKYLTEKLIEDITEEHSGKSSTFLISSAEFRHRIINIDIKHINNSTIDDLINELDPVFDFFDEQNDKDEKVIPVEALILFIDDKGYKPLAGFLEKKYMQISDAKLSKSEIKNIFSKLEESYNKYQDEDILNSSVNGFEEQINTFGDEDIAGKAIEEDIIEYEMEHKEPENDEDYVDLNEGMPEKNESETNINSSQTFKDMMKDYLTEFEIE